MTLDLWNNEFNNFNDAYTECDRINQMLKNFQNNGRVMSGMIIKDGDYRINDSKNPFINRTNFINNSNKQSNKKSKKFRKLKTVVTISGIVGIGYLGYKYIYKPIKKEYDAMLDRIVVKCESEKPLDGKIRVMTPLERKAFDHKYGNEIVVLDNSQYKVTDV
jgi:hypothetical protein